MTQPGETSVLHAYGVVSPAFAGSLPPGLGDQPVEVLPLRDLGILVSRLDAARFREAVWQEHGTDPAWVERIAEQHHRVLQAAIEQGDVLPLRLPGIYPDEQTLTSVLTQQADRLGTAFGRVRDHVEVGAKAFGGELKEEPSVGRPASGRDYLMRRAAAGSRREETRERRNAAVTAAYARMSGVAAAGVANPPQDPALSGRSEPMVLNAAFLIARDSLGAFIDLVEGVGADLRAEGVTLEVSGPWPPYNFVSEPSEVRTGADA